MSRSRLDGLKVLVVGIEELISRDVVRALVAEGAAATAASDERTGASLLRDLGFYRTTVNITPVELFSTAEMRLFAANLRGLGNLPHLIVCCCCGHDCPTTIAAPLLEPTLVLHAAPQEGGWLRRTAANLGVPSLSALLERRGLFNPDAGPRRVLIGSHAFILNRWEATPGRTASRRARLSTDRAAPAPAPAPRRGRFRPAAPALNPSPSQLHQEGS